MLATDLSCISAIFVYGADEQHRLKLAKLQAQTQVKVVVFEVPLGLEQSQIESFIRPIGLQLSQI